MTETPLPEFEYFLKREFLNPDVPVLIKVSSTVVTGALVDPRSSFLALKEMRADNVELPYALIAAKGAKGALVTIMEDLSSSHEMPWPKDRVDGGVNTKLSLWTAFQELLTKTLIPAAAKGIIFCDLWAGYDFTANILVDRKFADDKIGTVGDKQGIGLCRDKCGEDEKRPRDFELIAFDSFVSTAVYKRPDDDTRYLLDYDSAHTFVFVQVFVLGLTWKDETNMSEMKAEQICEDLYLLGLVENSKASKQDIDCLADFFKLVFTADADQEVNDPTTPRRELFFPFRENQDVEDSTLDAMRRFQLFCETGHIERW